MANFSSQVRTGMQRNEVFYLRLLKKYLQNWILSLISSLLDYYYSVLIGLSLFCLSTYYCCIISQSISLITSSALKNCMAPYFFLWNVPLDYHHYKGRELLCFVHACILCISNRGAWHRIVALIGICWIIHSKFLIWYSKFASTWFELTSPTFSLWCWLLVCPWSPCVYSSCGSPSSLLSKLYSSLLSELSRFLSFLRVLYYLILKYQLILHTGFNLHQFCLLCSIRGLNF